MIDAGIRYKKATGVFRPVDVTGTYRDGYERYETRRSSDRRLRQLVEHGVWKATYQGATVALVNDRVHLGSAPGVFQTRIDRTRKLLTQSGSPASIPEQR